MKKKVQLVFAIFLLLIGLLGVTFYIVLGISNVDVSKWTIAFLLCLYMIFYSSNDIVDCLTSKSLLERLLERKKYEVMLLIGALVILIGIILGVILNVNLVYIICGIGIIWCIIWIVKGDRK